MTSQPANYSYKKTAAKALKALALVAVSAVVTAVGDDTFLTDLFRDHPGALWAVPLLVALATAFENWRKNN